MSTKKTRVIILITILLSIVTLIFSGKIISFFVPEREIMRLTSPDKKVDVLLTEKNGGATTPYSYLIYIVPAGANYKKNREVFLADHVENLTVKWAKDKLLNISYDKARIYNFTNFWWSREVDYFNYVIEMQLKPTTSNSLD